MHRGSNRTHDSFVTMVTTLSSCMVALAICTAVDAAVVFEYAGNLQLDEGRHGQPRPVSVSTDADSGEIVVSDAAGSAIHVLHPGGGALYTTGALSGLSSPADAVPTPDGGFVFIDSDGDRGRTIRRLDLSGEPVAFAAEAPVRGWRPEHLAVTSDGHYLTLDPVTGLLAKHDAGDGSLIWRRALWADDGAESVCGRPSEAPDGRLYVPLSQEHRVLVLTADGRPDGSFGEVGTTPGKFSFPVDVAFGLDGLVMVLDRMRHVIVVFDENHDFVTEYGRMGSSPGAFYHPVSMTFASGRLYVAQGFEGRVQSFHVFRTEAVRRESTDAFSL